MLWSLPKLQIFLLLHPTKATSGTVYLLKSAAIINFNGAAFYVWRIATRATAGACNIFPLAFHAFPFGPYPFGK